MDRNPNCHDSRDHRSQQRNSKFSSFNRSERFRGPDGPSWRREKTQFIDGADAICQREMGSVNLLCRAGVIAGIAGENGEGIPLRLPYSESLYLVSTGGATYGK